MKTDTLVNRATVVTVTLVALFAAVISYYHIIHIGINHGGIGVSSPLTALSIDGTILASSFTMLYSNWHHITVPWLARVMMWLGVGATLACNVGYGVSYGVVGALFSVWPAIAFVGSVEMILQLGKNKRNQPVEDIEEKRYPEMLNLDAPIPGTIGGMGFTADEIKRATAPQFNPDTTLIGGIEDGQKPPAQRRKRDGLSVANIQKLAHCDQKRATRIRDLIRENGYDLDKAILIDEEAYPRRGNANERTDGDV